MDIGQIQYLPLAFPFYAILVGVFLGLFVLIQLGVLSYAYARLGLSRGAAMLVLLGSLLGSYINIPLFRFPDERVVSGQEIDYFGMRYVVPFVTDWPGTLIAVNVGGALIPAALSLYLLFRNRIVVPGAVATAVVALAVYLLAQPVKGVGVAVPVLAPPVITAIAALVFSREFAAPVAYVAGSLGTLIGADLFNLDKVAGLGAPVLAIGGAGTFDGIFLTGVLAVLLASLRIPSARQWEAHSSGSRQ